MQRGGPSKLQPRQIEALAANNSIGQLIPPCRNEESCTSSTLYLQPIKHMHADNHIRAFSCRKEEKRIPKNSISIAPLYPLPIGCTPPQNITSGGSPREERTNQMQPLKSQRRPLITTEIQEIHQPIRRAHSRPKLEQVFIQAQDA